MHEVAKTHQLYKYTQKCTTMKFSKAIMMNHIAKIYKCLVVQSTKMLRYVYSLYPLLDIT